MMIGTCFSAYESCVGKRSSKRMLPDIGVFVLQRENAGSRLSWTWILKVTREPRRQWRKTFYSHSALWVPSTFYK
jgi:hypothetical protein